MANFLHRWSVTQQNKTNKQPSIPLHTLLAKKHIKRDPPTQITKFFVTLQFKSNFDDSDSDDTTISEFDNKIAYQWSPRMHIRSDRVREKRHHPTKTQNQKGESLIFYSKTLSMIYLVVLFNGWIFNLDDHDDDVQKGGWQIGRSKLIFVSSPRITVTHKKHIVVYFDAFYSTTYDDEVMRWPITSN